MLSDASSILLKEGQPGVKRVSLLRLPSVADSRLQNEVLLQRGRQTGSFRQQRLILFHKINMWFQSLWVWIKNDTTLKMMAQSSPKKDRPPQHDPQSQQ